MHCTHNSVTIQKRLHRLPPGDPSEHERAQHRHRVRRGAVEVPGDLAGGVEAGDRLTAAVHAGARVGRQPAEGVGDGADHRPGEERRLDDSARPVRFRRRERRRRGEAVADCGVKLLRVEVLVSAPQRMRRPSSSCSAPYDPIF